MSNKAESIYKINPESVRLETDQGILESEERKWGMPLKEVYKHGLAFYKDKEGKALHLSYEDKLTLIAYTQQTAHGPLDSSSAPPLGVLDVIGRDRRAAWQALGQMTQIQAMVYFVHNLDRLCPLFKPYLEAIQKDLENKKLQELKKVEEERAQLELQNRIALEKQKQQSNKLTEEQQVQRIKDALNAQTYDQFVQYAQQQYPGNVDQQAVLIRQLQDQHYQQYIQQLAVDKRLANCTIKDEADDKENENDGLVKANNANVKSDNLIKAETASDSDYNLNEPEVNIIDTKRPFPSFLRRLCKPKRIRVSKSLNRYSSLSNASMDSNNLVLEFPNKTETNEYTEESRDDENSDDDDGLPVVEEARMWTRADMAQFKEMAREGGGRLNVGHGETITVRVPTHPRAKCICWEFATDNYDIGFGLYFEWSKSPTTDVTIHVSESDDEDELNDPDAPDYSDDGDTIHEYTIHGTRTDLELGGEKTTRVPTPSPPRPPVSLVVPIYRRDCHTEVYAGSHTYPGEGVYLLKFDNTYSLWRSKTLYYKIYYTQ